MEPEARTWGWRIESWCSVVLGVLGMKFIMRLQVPLVPLVGRGASRLSQGVGGGLPLRIRLWEL